MAERFPHKFADAVGDALSERCPDCGRRITESHEAFTEQWERAGSEELCFPNVNFGGTELCAERTVELLRSRITKLKAVVAAAAPMAAAMRRTVALGAGLGLEWANEEQMGLSAYDAAMAELERERGGET